MNLFHNDDQKKLYRLIKRHGSWSPAELIKHDDVKKFIGYDKKEHSSCRHRLAGRVQFLRKRLEKFEIPTA